MTRPRRGAIVGFGNVAAHGHVEGWRSRPDFEIVAVADPDPARRALAAEKLPTARLYEGHDRLFSEESIDFVDIAAPPSLHRVVIESASRAGVHVLCEKPLTTSPAEMDEILARVGSAGVVLHTVHNWKYSEAFRAVREAVDAGAVGPLTSVSFDTVRNGCSVATTGENWRMNSAIGGGGILVDHGWHAFYLLLALAGDAPLRVRAHLERRRYTDAQVEDSAHCVVEFPRMTGDIRLTWAGDERRTRWTVRGRDGEILVDDDVLQVSGPGGSYERRLSSGLSASSHHPDWFGGVVDEFRAALAGPERDNRREAALCVQLLHNAYDSDRVGRPVDIPRLP